MWTNKKKYNIRIHPVENTTYHNIVVVIIKYVVSCRPGRAAYQPELDRGMIYGRWTDTNGPFRPVDQVLCPNLDPQIYGELCTRALAQTDYCLCVCVCVFVLNIIYHNVNLIAEDVTKYYFFFKRKKAQFLGTRACSHRWSFYLNNNGDKSSFRDSVENGLDYICLFATIYRLSFEILYQKLTNAGNLKNIICLI